ncbi:MAG: NAD(P)-dependent oxidoreductase [Ilumatobacteraceae bacterium]
MSARRRVAVGPAGAPAWLRDAIVRGGGEPVAYGDATALVWWDPDDASGLETVLREHPGLAWIQLPNAGVEPFVHLLDDARTWTSAKGAYADVVAELALAMLLAGLRGVVAYGAATAWGPTAGRSLLGARVSVLGGGGIARSLVALLAPWRCEITVVRRSDAPFEGAARVLPASRYREALVGADGVVLALPLTPDTDGMIGRRELAMMRPHAWLVNVGRGRQVVTDDLVAALRDGTIGGAGLDVTEPEPLPAGHPLWSLPNCVITPHTAVSDEMTPPLLAARVADNVARWIRGDALVGPVSRAAGY